MTAKDDSAFEVRAEVLKVDESLGLVMGFAIVCSEAGEPYFDVQGDHIPEDAMLKAAADFMMNSRVAGQMHTDEDGVFTAVSQKAAADHGTVVFAWPLTEDIAKAFNILTHKTGLMIAVKPDKDMLEKFQLGEYTGFSIGGSRVKDEEVD
jgi:hypothetical protein